MRFMSRVINFIKRQYNNSAVGSVESYQAIVNGDFDMYAVSYHNKGEQDAKTK
jgi:hypothetical protein